MAVNGALRRGSFRIFRRTDGAHERTEVLWINPACAAALDRETTHPQLPGLIAAM